MKRKEAEEKAKLQEEFDIIRRTYEDEHEVNITTESALPICMLLFGGKWGASLG